MAGFKVPCPSCEHQVPIKNEKAIGTKVECPKCKYRFKVEEPAGGIPKEEKKKKKGGEDAGKKKKKSKKTIAVVVGVLAVVVLGVVGFAVIGGGEKPKSGPGQFAGPGPDRNPNPVDPNPVDPKDVTPKDSKDDGKKTEPKKVVPVANPSDKEATNLLPNQTVALFRLDVEKIRLTPASFAFDRAGLDMFRTSLGVEADQVALYFHAFVGDNRDPFGVIQLKTPVLEKDVVAAMAPTASDRVIKKKWRLHAFRFNPFVNAVSNSLAFTSLFADLYDRLPPGADKGPARPRVIGLCVYDSQHILVGDHAQLEGFLNGLDARGFPKFRSAVEAPGEGVVLAEKPLYLSIDPKLKRSLIDLGAETGSPPPVLYAERVAQGLFDPKLMKADLQPIASVLDPIMTNTEYVAASINSFSTGQFAATVRLGMKSNTAAFELVRDQLTPNLPLAAWATGLFLNTNVEFRNLTAGGMAVPMPGVGPMGQPPMGPMGQPPVGPMGQPPVGPMGPGTQPMGDDPPQLLPSHIDLGLTDQTVTIAVELNWAGDVFRRKIEPRLVGTVNTLKGKMAVFASDTSYQGLVAAVPRMTEVTKQFPRGTAERKLTDASRLGLRYKPETRVSLFAGMLPFLGRDGLARSINRDIAWYEGENLQAGEAWVPELLVPTYPQSAWRATSPFVSDGRVLGGTNYVGIAGVGLDVARQDPAAPEYAKKVGIVGYDWGSKVEDVKDGLSNTIYLMQTPPGLSQPWIAGGGATVRGLDEESPMRGFAHTYSTPNGKPGTYALMGDGSVRFVPASINPKVLLAMGTRAGMEDLAELNTAAPRVDPPKKPEPEVKAAPKPVDPAPKEKAAGPKAVDPKDKAPADPKVGATEPAPPPREK